MLPSQISVCLCTHNPRPEILEKTLASLRVQTLSASEWELLVIDNSSTQPLALTLDLAWHPNGRVIRENCLGLVHARTRAIHEARSECLVFVDDDNWLSATYLAEAKSFFIAHPGVGVFSGRSKLEFESPPPAWLAPYTRCLGDIDEGDTPRFMPPFKLPHRGEFHPIGAGLCLRREVAQRYIAGLPDAPLRARLGRKGSALTSGEDVDIVCEALESGYAAAYAPNLELRHFITSTRLELGYIQRLYEGCWHAQYTLEFARGLKRCPAYASEVAIRAALLHLLYRWPFRLLRGGFASRMRRFKVEAWRGAAMEALDFNRSAGERLSANSSRSSQRIPERTRSAD